MSLEVDTPQQEITVTNPATGEVLSASSPTEDLGRYLADVREYELLLREAKRMVTREVLARMDRSASWTLHVAGLKLSGKSPVPVEEWDELALRESLLGLVDEGVLAVEAVDAAVEPVVSYKARKAGINALRKLGGKAAEAVERHRRVVDKERYVSVGRS